MELFSKLFNAMKDGNTVSINIAKKDDQFVVNVLPGTNLVKDNAKNGIQPLVMRGTAEDFDKGFENAIIAPIEKANGLFTDLKSFEDSVEKARQESEMAKKAKDAEAKKKTDSEGWLKLAERNLEDSKFKDAKTCIEEASKLLGKDDKRIVSINQRCDDLSGKGGLFGAEIEDKSDGLLIKLSDLKKLTEKPAEAKPADIKEADESEEEDNND